MADTLATVYTQVRAMVPGANTTNMPDASLLPVANRVYRWLGQNAMPGNVRHPGGTFGFTLAANALTATCSTAVLWTRITAVYDEGTDLADTDSEDRVEYVDEGTYRLERATFPSVTAGKPRIAHWKKLRNGTWTILVHPANDAAIRYLSIEGEVEISDLTSGASTVVLTPQLTEAFKTLMAHEVGRLLGRDDAWFGNLLATMPDRKLAAAWQNREVERGSTLKSPPERHG